MCHPAAPIAMKRRSILVHSVRRVLPPTASSCHRISKPPQLYSSTLGASARVTVVSVTCGAGAPTVVSFTVVPTIPRLPSASKGAHSRSCAERGHGRDDQQDRAHHLEHAECAPSAARERAHVIRERVELKHLVCAAREVEEGERDLEDPQQDVHRFLLVFLFVGVDWSMRSRWRSRAST